MNERASLLIIGIGVFVAGCALGAAAYDQILGAILWALSPTLAMMVPVSVTTQIFFPLSIAVAPGVFLATPIVAIALARPVVTSFLLRTVACYLLSALISIALALVWSYRAAAGGESSLHIADIPVLSVTVAGPMIVIAVAWFLSARSADGHR